MQAFQGFKTDAEAAVAPINRFWQIDKPSEEACIAAIKADPTILRHANVRQTVPVIVAALQQDGMMLGHVRVQVPWAVLMAVRETPTALMYAQEQTLEVCRVAYVQSSSSARHIRNYQMWRETVYAKCFSAEAVVSAHHNQLLGGVGPSEVVAVLAHVFRGKTTPQSVVKAELERQLPWLDGFEHWRFKPDSAMQFWLLPKELPE